MKKLLYVTPHLSTGGLPQYLLRKIELLKDTYDIYVVEYTNVSDHYVVQKNAIKKLLGNKYFLLGDNKAELLKIIDMFQPDIIHLEEIVEYFMDYKIAEKIYQKGRKYSIVETTHSSDYDITKKIFIPDKFMGVCQFTTVQYANLDIPLEIVEYPIDVQKYNKAEYQAKVGFDPSYKHVITVGLFTPRKNQGYVFDIAKKLKDKRIMFHFIGNQADNFRHYWEPAMKTKPDNCIIHGEKSNVNEYLRACDLSVFASKGQLGDMELNPLVIKETLNENVPLLMYNLDVYLGKYNSHPLVRFLTGDPDKDAQTVLSLVSADDKKKDDLSGDGKVRIDTPTPGYKFAVRWDENEQRLYHTLLSDTLANIKGRISIRDIDTNLVYFSDYIDFYPGCWWWTTPFSYGWQGDVKSKIGKGLNGFLVQMFDVKGKQIWEESIRFSTTAKKSEFRYECSPHDITASSYLDFYFNGLGKDLDFRDKVVVDAGANVGIFTQFALERGAKKIYAIEADPRAFKYLSMNFINNPKVMLFDKALNTSNGTAEFCYASEYHTVGSSLVNRPEATTNIIQVSCMTMKDVFEYGPIDILKLDIEGSEEYVLNALSDFQLSSIPEYYIEFHNNNTGWVGAIKTRFERLGFGVSFYTNQNEQSHTGHMFVSKRKPQVFEIKETDKTLIIIGSYPNTPEKLNTLKECVKSVKCTGFDTLLVSHLPIPSDVSKLSNYCYTDDNNKMDLFKTLKNYEPDYWMRQGNFLVKSINTIHIRPIVEMIKSGIAIAIQRGYKNFVYMEGDTIFGKKDAILLKQILEDMRTMDRKAVFHEVYPSEWSWYYGENKKIPYETLIFAGETKWFYDKCTFLHKDWDEYIKQHEAKYGNHGYAFELMMADVFDVFKDSLYLLPRLNKVYRHSVVNKYIFGGCHGVFYNLKDPNHPVIFINNNSNEVKKYRIMAGMESWEFELNGNWWWMEVFKGDISQHNMDCTIQVYNKDGLEADYSRVFTKDNIEDLANYHTIEFIG